MANIATMPQAALIYRLNGDYNPLHSDPEAAKQRGFSGPILHGLCTLGIAARTVLASCCDYDPEGIREFGARFTAPVMPGETLQVGIWRSRGMSVVPRLGASKAGQSPR